MKETNEQIEPSEYESQCAYIEWVRVMENRHTDLQRLFAVPNGENRHPVTGARLKRAGVKPGVPDIILPVARGGYNLLAIELKTSTGNLSPEQKRYIAAIRESGSCVAVCRSAAEAIEATIEYLRGRPWDNGETLKEIGSKYCVSGGKEDKEN